MTITTRQSVRAAIERALHLSPDLDAAIHAVAQSMSLPAETVRECWEEQEQGHA